MGVVVSGIKGVYFNERRQTIAIPWEKRRIAVLTFSTILRLTEKDDIIGK
jgi:hypothetical protein